MSDDPYGDRRLLITANPDRMMALAGLVDTDPEFFELQVNDRVPPAWC